MVGRMVVLCKVLRVLAVALGPEITNWLTWGKRVERRRRRDSRGRQDRCGRWCRCRCWCRCGRWGRCWGWCWCRWWCRCWCLGAKEARERLLTRLRLGGRRHSRAFLDWREEIHTDPSVFGWGATLHLPNTLAPGLTPSSTSGDICRRDCSFLVWDKNVALSF